MLALSALALFSCAGSGSSASDVSSSSSTSQSSSEETVEYIILNYSALTLEVGATATIAIEDPSGTVDNSLATFITVDSTVASVSSLGVITGITEGETKIFVSYKGASSSLLLTVTKTYPEVIKQREGTLDVGLSVVSTDSTLLTRGLSVPLEMRYTTKNNHKNSDGEFLLSFSPNEATENGSAEDNFTYLTTIFNLQNIFPGLSLLADFSALPGQYKAIGASYRDFDGVPENNEYFYLLETDERTSFGSYSDQDGSYLPRLNYSTDSILEEFETMITILQYLGTADLSSIDYVAYLNQYFEDGVISDATTNSRLETFLKLLIYVLDNFTISKEAVTVDSYSGIKFTFAAVDGISQDITSIANSLLSRLGFNLGNVTVNVEEMEMSFVIYTDNYQNTCLSSFSESVSLSLVQGYSLAYTFDYAMGTSETVVEDSTYLDTFLELDDSFITTATRFKNFYNKISPAVSFFVGDAPSSALDITESYGNTLDTYAAQYENLTNSVKFMLSSRVSATSIKTNYMLGRTALFTAAGSFLFVHDYEAAVNAVSSVSEYLNWDVAFEESYPSYYEDLLSYESEYAESLKSNVEAMTSSLASYVSTSSVSDSASLFASAVALITGESGSVKEFAVDNGNAVVSALSSTVEELLSASSSSLLDALYEAALSKFVSILSSSSSDSEKLSDLWTLYVGEGTTPLLYGYLTSYNGSSFVSNGKHAAFVGDIADASSGSSASSILLNMNAKLISDKRIEGYSLYGSESWSIFVSEASALISQVTSLEQAVYGSAQTDTSALSTLIAD